MDEQQKGTDSGVFVAIIVMLLAVGGGVVFFVAESPSKVMQSDPPRLASTQPLKLAAAEPQESAKPDEPQPKDKALLDQPKEVEEGFAPDPRFIVEPVAEPAEPSDEEMRKLVAEKKANAQFFKFGGWAKYTGDDRRIVLPATVNMRRGLIEYFICAENSGKEHETVIEIACDPAQLVIAMNLLMMKKGPPPKTLSIDEAGQGDRVIVSLQWKTDDGKTVTYRAEDLLIDTVRGATMPRVGWTYTGSYFTEYQDPDTGEKKKFFVAIAEKRIISAFRDPSCILDSPLPDADQDQAIFDPNPSIIPKVGTPMVVIIRPLKPDERRAIAETEKKHREKGKK